MQHCANDGSRGVEQAEVFAEDWNGRKRVQLDGTLPAAMSVHERLEEAVGSGMERLVIGVAGDAVCVKCDDGVDGGLRCVLGRNRRHVGGKGRGKQVGN